jgi:hypothetical protein
VLKESGESDDLPADMLAVPTASAKMSALAPLVFRQDMQASFSLRAQATDIASKAAVALCWHGL